MEKVLATVAVLVAAVGTLLNCLAGNALGAAGCLLTVIALAVWLRRIRMRELTSRD